MKLQRLFPQRIQPPPQLLAFLRRMYPNIPWQKVQIYEGLPWFLPGWVSGIVLPASLHHQNFHIYLKKWDYQSVTNLSTLVHEAYHVQQAFDLGQGRGVGWFRGFLFRYFGYYLQAYLRHPQQAYRQHPMEIPAFGQGDTFFNDFLAFRSTKSIANHPEILAEFMDQHPYMVVHKSQFPPLPFAYQLPALLAVVFVSLLFPLSLLLFRLLALPAYLSTPLKS